MADVDEDDGYSDDDLDALPNDAFHELQQHAIRSTQEPSFNATSYALKQSLGASFFDVPNVEKGHSAIQDPAVSVGPDPNRIPQPSSDYGDLDDEVLDGEVLEITGPQPFVNNHFDSNLRNVYGERTQREHWRQPRYAIPLKPLGHQANQSYQESEAIPNPPQRRIDSVDGDGNHDKNEAMLDEPRGENLGHAKPILLSDSANVLQAKVDQVCTRSHVVMHISIS